MVLTLAIIFTVIFTSSMYYYVHSPKYLNCSNTKSPPQATGAWPIIGHLHLLGGPQALPRTLGTMADKLGPIFTLKLGMHQVLVVSDSNLAKECFTTNDKSFVKRPKSIAIEVMGYNHAIFSLGPYYGPYWRKVRKTMVNDVFSHRQMEVIERIRVSEVRATMKNIYVHCKKNEDNVVKVRFEMKEMFDKLLLKMVLKMVIGKQCSTNDEHMKIQKVLDDFLLMLGTSVVGDEIPWLRWLDIGGHEKLMKKTFLEVDSILQEALEEKKKGDYTDENKDFMDVILSNLDGFSDEELGGFDPDVVAKSTCLILFIATIDTSVATMVWIMALLLNNKQAFKMVQEELDLHVGRERRVKESDINNLTYLQAVLKETLRLYPAGPLLLPHESIEDCVIGGYHIQKGTRLLVNLWKIHRDPVHWPDPTEFRPDRFLTTHKDVDFKGQHFEFIPFGSGRRICPGYPLATQDMLFVVASLIHGFEIMSVDSNVAIDMTEGYRLANIKATPLEVLLTPKLSQDLYE